MSDPLPFEDSAIKGLATLREGLREPPRALMQCPRCGLELRIWLGRGSSKWMASHPLQGRMYPALPECPWRLATWMGNFATEAELRAAFPFDPRMASPGATDQIRLWIDRLCLIFRAERRKKMEELMEKISPGEDWLK